MLLLPPANASLLKPSRRFDQALARYNAIAPVELRPLPPAPAVFGTGPLTSQTLMGSPNLHRFQKCADVDMGHFMKGQSGDHIQELKLHLAFLMARIANPGTVDKENEIILAHYNLMKERDGPNYFGGQTAGTVGAYKTKFGILNSQGQIDNIVGKKTMRLMDMHLDFV